MVQLFLLTALLACATNEAPPPAPAPAPEPPPVAAPAPAPVDAVNKDVDISSMNDADKKAFLMTLGERVYKVGDNSPGAIACTTCHGEGGLGTPGAFPPLVGQKEFMGDCKKHSSYVIKGLNGEIIVNGQKYNGVMVAQGAALNDLQIAAVVTYERNSWGNDYGVCLPDDVKAARAL